MHSLVTSLLAKIIAGTLSVATATGAVVAMANDDSASTPTAANQSAQVETSKAQPEPVVSGRGLILEPVIVAAPAVPAPVPNATKAVAPKKAAATKVSVAAAPSEVKAACTSLVAGKLGDLRNFIKKTAAQDPSLAAGAAKVLAKLDAYDGGGLCAANLNEVRDSLCADGEAATTLRRLVGKAPFMVRMAVGDPCTADMEKMSALAAKYL